MARKKKAKQTNQALLNKMRHFGKSGSVRIIAGQWRGRKLVFSGDVKGLRPTPERTRETLFNWLQGSLYEAHCLDLFAGSGALGFEALSRGAAHVTFIEKHPRVVKQLEANRVLLEISTTAATIIQADALTCLQRLLDLQNLQRGARVLAYDIIFLDPPFHQALLAAIVPLLKKYSLLTTTAMLYMEYAREEVIGETIEVVENNGFVLHRQNKAGQVVSCLYKHSDT